MQIKLITLLGATVAMTAVAATQTSTITVHGDQVLHRVTPYLSGACIEDVNHEIYGGIDSQLIFGESFAEPAAQLPLQGFSAYGGRWTIADDGSMQGVGGDGAKTIWNGPVISDGEISVDVKLTETTGGNGGLILKVADAGKGADTFTGYEVSLERPGFLVLGRHRQNWEPLRRIPCEVPVGEWINLKVKLSGKAMEIFVNGQSVTQYEDTEHPLEAGSVGVRIWQHKVLFRELTVTSGGSTQKIPFAYDAKNQATDMVSGMWRTVRSGDARGSFSLVSRDAFSGGQSQLIRFESGSGVIGIENQSLNRWGMNFVKGKAYEGYVYVRSDEAATFRVALESKDGTKIYAEQALKAKAGGWRKVEFTLKPNAADKEGRFCIKLREPGAITLGYAFLQPGSWGRFKGLPVRKDVAEGLMNQGVTILRYGGSMINNPEYRWKKMVGPRALRPPYEGHWYPYSSDGWGIFDFLNFCEAAGFLGIPAVDINESPQDMGDLMDYLNASSANEWGKKRVVDGHPAPYRLRYMELGNEERVDENYYQKFKALAEVIWAKDPSIILIVGDFAYHRKITDPFNFSGADGGINSLAGQQKILQLAKQYGREVWFDLHVGTEGPRPDSSLEGMFSYINAMESIADGARFKVLVFELNANNPSQRRALANALAIGAIQRDGRLPITCSANSLQPDGQNDNGWDQGLLFLNPAQVWLQPPGYVTKMISQNYLPLVIKSDSSNQNIDVVATRSEDGKTVVLQAVNTDEQAARVDLQLEGCGSVGPVARVSELAGPLRAANSAAAPEQIKPRTFDWKRPAKEGKAIYTLPAHSVTVMRFNASVAKPAK